MISCAGCQNVEKSQLVSCSISGLLQQTGSGETQKKRKQNHWFIFQSKQILDQDLQSSS